MNYYLFKLGFFSDLNAQDAILLNNFLSRQVEVKWQVLESH